MEKAADAACFRKFQQSLAVRLAVLLDLIFSAVYVGCRGAVSPLASGASRSVSPQKSTAIIDSTMLERKGERVREREENGRLEAFQGVYIS